MLREITLGQYYPADSVIHRLDPRVKLLTTLVFIITLFTFHTPANYVFAAVCLGIVIGFSTVPFSFITKGLHSIFILMLITVAFNLFLTSGRVIFKLGFLTVTYEGLMLALGMAVRLILLYFGLLFSLDAFWLILSIVLSCIHLRYLLNHY